MGIPESSRPGDLLASGHLALAHARLPTVRPQSHWASPGQSAVSLRERTAALCGAAAVDRQILEQRICGGAVCDSSAAGGYGRVDHGTEKFAERIILDADTAGLFAIRAQTRSSALCASTALVHYWADVQTGAGGASWGDAPVGYLAAAAVEVGSPEFARGRRGNAGAGMCASPIECRPAGTGRLGAAGSRL